MRVTAPVQQNFIEVQLLAVQFQLRPETMAGQSEHCRLWVVLDTTHQTVLNLARGDGVGPDHQLLPKQQPGSNN